MTPGPAAGHLSRRAVQRARIGLIEGGISHFGFCRDQRLMTNSDSRIAVYTGSFDPITLGHLNVIGPSSRLVDRLIVGIGVNIEKQSLFTPEERVELVRCTTAALTNVEVLAFSGLAVNFVRKSGAHLLLRGVSLAWRHRGRVYDDDGQSKARSRDRNGLSHGR